MSANVNLSLTSNAWADIVIKMWRNKITELDIGRSGHLFDSFTSEVISNAGGSPERIDFAFLYYGKFTDMGVGNGVSYGNPENVRTKRRPKRWYGSILFSQTIKLSEIISDKYGILGAGVISETLRRGERQMPVHSNSPHATVADVHVSELTDLDRAWMKRNSLL